MSTYQVELSSLEISWVILTIIFKSMTIDIKLLLKQSEKKFNLFHYNFKPQQIFNKWGHEKTTLKFKKLTVNVSDSLTFASPLI